MPNFNEMTKKEFLDGLKLAGNDPEKFFQEQTKDLNPSSEDYQKKLYAQKRAFLIHCINSDIDEPTFAQNIKKNEISWNPENDELLSGAADQFYPSDEEGTDVTISDANAQYQMTDLFLNKLENADAYHPNRQDAVLLQRIITNFSPLDMWEKKYRIREAFIGERLISNSVSEEDRKEHVKEIGIIKKKLDQNVENLLANDYIDNGVDDEYVSLDDDIKMPNIDYDENADFENAKNANEIKNSIPNVIPKDIPQENNIRNNADNTIIIEEIKEPLQKEEKPAGPVVIEDPQGSYRIERTALPLDNAKNALLEKLTQNISANEKESWLFSYMLSDLSDDAFKKKVAEIKQTKQLNGLVNSILNASTKEGFAEKLFTQQFEERVKNAFTNSDFGVSINTAMQAGSTISKFNRNLEKAAEEKRLNELKEKELAEQKKQQAAREEKNKEIKFKTFQTLDLLERGPIKDFYNMVFDIKKKANLPGANEDSKIQSQAVDTYLTSSFFNDSKKAKAFCHYAGENRAKTLYQLGIEYDEELEKLKNGQNLWEPFQAFGSDAEMSSAAVSMMLYANTNANKGKIDAFEEIDHLIPEAFKPTYNQSINQALAPMNAFLDSPQELYEKGNRLKSETKKAEILGFQSDPHKKYPIITDAARNELESRKNEPGARNQVTRKQKNQETIQSYTEALDQFNTARASFFKQESRTHLRVRNAAENLRKMREDLNLTNPSTHLVKLDQEKDKREFAKKWLDMANTLAYESNRYLNKKSPLTFAGRDRKTGAGMLKRLADNEVRLCEIAILSQANYTDFTVKDIYLDIAKDKQKSADHTLETFDFSIPAAEANGKSIADQMKEKKEIVKNAICDAVAASASQKQLSGNQRQNVAANYFAMRRQLERSTAFQQAVNAYLDAPQNWSRNTIRFDLEDGGKGLISKLKTINTRLNMDNVLKQQPQPQRAL